MKWKADWWGIQILAETVDDVDILESLDKALPGKAVECHDIGTKFFLKKEDGFKHPHSERYGQMKTLFTEEEIDESKLIMHINR